VKTRLEEAIQDYDYFRLSDGIAANTRKNDQYTLRLFLKHVGDIQLASIKERHMTEYLAERGRTLEASTLKLEMTRLRSFFKWARNTRRMPRDLDPLAGRRGPRPIKRERRRIHVSQFPTLLDMAGERCGRDRMLVALGLYSLLRDQEMLTLRIRDVNLDSGEFFTRIHKSRLEDSLGISPALDLELRRWFKDYQSICGPLQPDWFLLPTRKTHITKESHVLGHKPVDYIPERALTKSHYVVQPLLEDFGIPLRRDNGSSAREGAHTLRRSGARALYDLWVEKGNVDALNMVRVTLHHADVKDTQHYIGLGEDRKTRNDLLHEVRYPFEADNVARMERKTG